jgi:hypothetical protein
MSLPVFTVEERLTQIREALLDLDRLDALTDKARQALQTERTEIRYQMGEEYPR